jgi:hypothetical protein
VLPSNSIIGFEPHALLRRHGHAADANDIAEVAVVAGVAVAGVAVGKMRGYRFHTRCSFLPDGLRKNGCRPERGWTLKCTQPSKVRSNDAKSAQPETMPL